MGAAATKIPVEAEKRILSFNEACTYLNVKRPTLYSWLSAGKIPAFKVEGSSLWRFDRQELEQWIEKQKELSRNE